MRKLRTEGVKGNITVEHTVWCGCCAQWEQYPTSTKRAMVRAAKSNGWALTRAYGWLCPECAAARS